MSTGLKVVVAPQNAALESSCNQFLVKGVKIQKNCEIYEIEKGIIN